VSFKFFSNKLRRFFSYYKFKLARLPASSYAISAGFACGSMVSFTPLIGFHFVLAVMFAYLLRANYIAALIGTIVGNPISFPLIWGLIYKVGAFIVDKPEDNLRPNINFEIIINQTYDIFIPMLVGGAVLAIPIWVTTYFITYSFVSSFKKAKQKNKKKIRG
jgi:uncharacterized protein (DUF2062 family)